MLSNTLANLFGRFPVLAWGTVTAILLMLFLCGLSTNPPGFYMDESCIAYNGYLVAQTGVSEAGQSFPVFFQCYTEGYIQWMNSELVYLLAALYSIVPPSVLSARIFSATLVFIATLLLGVLAYRLSGRRAVGVIVTLTAMATPWFFEISRLVQETSVLVLAIVLFLFVLHRTFRRDEWAWRETIALGLSLGLITYAYAAGRVLAPGFTFGLLIFAVNRRALFGVFKTWAVYALTLVPLVVVYFTNRNAITGRFHEVSYMTPDRSWLSIIGEFITNFVQDLSPVFLLLDGDKLLRHHVPGMGEIFAVTFILALVGIVFFIIRNWHDPWWRFVVVGMFISLVPGALTVNRHHALRLIALPIFLTLLTVPALSWLAGDAASHRLDTGRIDNEVESGTPGSIGALIASPIARRVMLGMVLILTFLQGVIFQMQFREIGPTRSHYFDAAYPAVLSVALADSSRPVYLEDGYWGPAYIHAYWYAAINGIDPASFVHVTQSVVPPMNSLVLTSNMECSGCQKVYQEGSYLLYRKINAVVEDVPEVVQSANSHSLLKNPEILAEGDPEAVQFAPPRGVATDAFGNIYLADTGRSQIRKLDPDGKLLLSFGSKGDGAGELLEPNGICVDDLGNIYVVDALNHKLIKFDIDGVFLKEWGNPEVSFYGPRDLSIGSNGMLYIIDQGNNRIVIFDPQNESFSGWGSVGPGPGQFGNPTGIGIGNDLVFVADAGNDRIQVFDLSGKFLRQWSVAAWQQFSGHYPDLAFDERSNRLFVSNGFGNEILEFSANGIELSKYIARDNQILNIPSSLTISRDDRGSRLIFLNTGRQTVSLLEISESK